MPTEKKVNLDKSELDYIEEMKIIPDEGIYYCSECNDKGYKLVPQENDIEQINLCKCEKKKLWHKTFEEAGVPRDFLDLTIESSWNLNQDAFGNDLGPQKPLKEKIGRWMEKYINAIPALISGLKLTVISKHKCPTKINSVLIVGGVKSGKSLLSSVAVQQTLLKGFTARIYDWIFLCNILSQYECREEQNAIVEDFAYCDLIVIDGVENYDIHSPCFKIQLDRISRERLRSGKPLIITSDLNYEKIVSGNSWISLLQSCHKIVLPKLIQKTQSPTVNIPTRKKITFDD